MTSLNPAVRASLVSSQRGRRRHRWQRWRWLTIGGLLAAMTWVWMAPWNFTPYGASASTMAGFNPSHRIVLEHGLNAYWDSSWQHQGVSLRAMRVVSGRVYGIGASSHQLIAMSAKDGREIWRRAFSGPVVAPLIIVGGTVAFLESGSRPKVVAVAAASGQVLWSTRVRPGVKLVFAQGLLWLLNGDNVVGRSMRTGGEMKSYAISGLSDIHSVLAQGSNLLIGGGHPYRQYFFNLIRGQLLWTDRLQPGFRFGIPAISGTSIYLPRLSQRAGVLGMEALTLTTGKVLWQRSLGVFVLPMDQAMHAGMAVTADHTVYLASALTDTLYALNAPTGNLLWQNQLGQEPPVTSPLPIAGQVIVADQYGVVWDLNQQSGQIQYFRKIAPTMAAQMLILVGKSLYLSTPRAVLALPLGRLAPGLAGGYHLHASDLLPNLTEAPTPSTATGGPVSLARSPGRGVRSSDVATMKRGLM